MGRVLLGQERGVASKGEEVGTARSPEPNSRARGLPRCKQDPDPLGAQPSGDSACFQMEPQNQNA